MRLINASTLKLEEFVDGRKAPRYAILSHTWGKDEVLFHDMANIDGMTRKKEGWKKIQHTCDSALRDGIYFAWVDTCCIDKTSSAELSEAINSMFAWYRDSAVCYIYLADVTTDSYYYGDLPRLFGIKAADRDKEDETRYTEYIQEIAPRLSRSRWFTRGWTLQELLAPRQLEFYSKDWTHLGSGRYLIDVLSSITKIKASVIRREESVSSCSVACRMSWAANRQTTRIEDVAYCLLGLFGINMPLLYGEGDKAFLRLQKEIIQVSDDQTILACAHEYNRDGIWSVVLARSPAYFANCGSLVPLLPTPDSSRGSRVDMEVTLSGVHLSAPLLSQGRRLNYGRLAILNCIDEHRPAGMIALEVIRVGNAASSRYYISGETLIVYLDRKTREHIKPKRLTLQDSWGQQSEKGSVRRLLRIRCVVEDATRFRATIVETFPPEAWQSSNLCRNRHWLRAFRLHIDEKSEAGKWSCTEMIIAFHDTRGRAFAFVEGQKGSNSNSLEFLCRYLDKNFTNMRETAYSRHDAFTLGYSHHWFDSGPYRICVLHDPFPADDVHANLVVLVEKRFDASRPVFNVLGMLLNVFKEDSWWYLKVALSRVSAGLRHGSEQEVEAEMFAATNLMLDRRQFYDTATQRFYVRLSATWPQLTAFRIALFQALASTVLLWISYLIIRRLIVRSSTLNPPYSIDDTFRHRQVVT